MNCNPQAESRQPKIHDRRLRDHGRCVLFLFMLLVSVVGCFVEWVEELCVNYKLYEMILARGPQTVCVCNLCGAILKNDGTMVVEYCGAILKNDGTMVVEYKKHNVGQVVRANHLSQ